MKKTVVRVIAFLLICGVILASLPNAPASAATSKPREKRSIAIVFDNSGSMYSKRNTAWARATYAMEVFARMLNEGDSLSIYPMVPITVDNQEYGPAPLDDNPYFFDFNNFKPLRITGPQDAGKIRTIYTPLPGDTHIESIQAAYDGLIGESGEQWLIVLTDGDTFYRNDDPLDNTVEELRVCLEQYNQRVNVMYLGIGQKAAIPNCTENPNHTLLVDSARDTAQVLSKLTDMCNTIFGRDTLPKNHFSNGGNTLDLDVSMNKLIVFIQGENVSNVVLSSSAGQSVAAEQSYETKYPENGAGNYSEIVTDESLQGMLLTYEGIPGDDYTLSYSGQNANVEVYYEPNVDMEFTFTDEQGNQVDPNDLYEGNYKLSFGMKDGVTGEYTQSDLLGDITYSGHYYINDQEYPINYTGNSGSVDIRLNVGDKFNADMDVTYLGGYTIHKDSTDFGWPDIGIVIKPYAASTLAINVESPANTTYQLSELEDGEPFRVSFTYDGNPLTGAEFDAVEFNCQQDEGAVLDVQKGDNCYIIYLKHKNPAVPEETPVGTFSVSLSADYTAPASEPSHASGSFSYTIEFNSIGIEIVLDKKQDYFVIRDIKGSEELITTATVKLSEGEMTPEQMQALQFSAVCEKEGIDIIVRQPNENEPVYEIWLKGSDALKEGSYTIKFNASTIDDLGHTVPAKEKVMSVSMSTIPRWLKILIISLIALLLLLIILAILHIKALPTKLHTTKRQCQMTVDGEDVSPHTVFDSKLEKKRVTVMSKYAGKKIGVVMDVKPGKGSYVRTPQVKRIAEVASSSVKKQGNAQVSEILIGSVKYAFNEDTKKFERMPKSDKPFNLRNGATVVYRGTFQSNGDDKDFSTSVKLNFKKKK